MQEWGTGHVKYCLCTALPSLLQKASIQLDQLLATIPMACGIQGKGSCIIPVQEITKILSCRLLVSQILPYFSFEVFKECDYWIFSPSEKLCGCSPVRSAWEKQDSSHLIYDVSASDVDNLHLFHSLQTPLESMRRNKHFQDMNHLMHFRHLHQIWFTSTVALPISSLFHYRENLAQKQMSPSKVRWDKSHTDSLLQMC